MSSSARQKPERNLEQFREVHKAPALIREWLKDHQDDLQEMWDKQIIKKLPPLK